MELNEKFNDLIGNHLESFGIDSGVTHMVVYVAIANDKKSPSFQVVGQWPENGKVLAPIDRDPELRVASSRRRWYPLQDNDFLMGVLRVERDLSADDWPDNLDCRLRALSSSLAKCISLEMERRKLLDEISIKKEQIDLIIHQLRNPLSALKTYAKLLLKKIDSESVNFELVQGILSEQDQLTKYLNIFDNWNDLKLSTNNVDGSRLLLPPNINNEQKIIIQDLLQPLLDRGKSRSQLRGNHWSSPSKWPSWSLSLLDSKYSVIAEIVANLLENAFLYTSISSQIGVDLNEKGICVWDSGVAIPINEKKRIFEKGFRGSTSSRKKGTGVGLFVAKKLAQNIDGELYLLESPYQFNQDLPKMGNTFFIEIPVKKLMKNK